MDGDTAAAGLLLLSAMGRPKRAPDPDKLGDLLTVEQMMAFAQLVLRTAQYVIGDDGERVER
jgi:hypothetical protein